MLLLCKRKQLIDSSQIQYVQSLREEIEQIDVHQIRTHATSYSKEFGLYSI